MKVSRRSLTVAAAVAASALAVAIVVSAGSGASLQRFFSGGTSGLHPSSASVDRTFCCGGEYPCAVQPTNSTSYECCRCDCYWGSAQKTGTSPQVIPCALEPGAIACQYCPPVPCTGVCPMGAPPVAGP